MNVTEDQFVKEVVTRLVAEHGLDENQLMDDYEKKIREAYPTEQHITPDDLDALVGDEVSSDIQDAYPLLNKIVLSSFLDIEDEEDDDDDEDDEEDDEEEEDDDED